VARIFLAIPLSEEIKSKVLQVNSVNRNVQKIVWMKPENLHITIYFIGQVPRDINETIIEKISAVLKQQSSLKIKFEQFCPAPSEKPRMIWAKFHRDKDFTALSNKIHTQIKEFIPNNAFYYDDPIPHITLARFNSTFDPSLIRFPEIDLKEIEIKNCELWESVSSKEGVKYECRRKIIRPPVNIIKLLAR
jgi:2'-5' RNA ligase